MKEDPWGHGNDKRKRTETKQTQSLISVHRDSTKTETQRTRKCCLEIKTFLKRAGDKHSVESEDEGKEIPQKAE